MTSANFCHWMQGFFEISDSDTLTEKQVKMIKAHLNLVFKHEIDPIILDGKSDLEKFEYTEIHRGKKDGDKIDLDEFKKLCGDEAKELELGVPKSLVGFPKAFYSDEIKLNC